MKDVPPPPLREQAFKATLGTGLVCAAVQQGKTMHRESCGNDHMPLTRGYMQPLYPLLHTPVQEQPLVRTAVYGGTLVYQSTGKIKCLP